MTLSREQLILAEILARLNGAALGDLAKPVGLVFERSRMRGLDPASLPFGAVYPLNEATERKNTAGQASLSVKVALWAKARPDMPIDQDLDPMWLWVHQQLMADESLGCLAMAVTPIGKVWGWDLSAQPMGDLDLHYLITFRHNLTNPCLP